jgi:ATP-dependent exoDNAse (exonuclease V) beta subunit
VVMTRARDRLLICGPANPKKSTWMAALNKVFDLADRRHNDLITGTGWQARVVQQARSAAITAESTSTPAYDIERLLHRAAVLHPLLTPGQSIPVGALLDRMHISAGKHSGAISRKDELDRRRLGTAAHAMLECWNLADAPPVAATAQRWFPEPGQNAMCVRELTAIATQVQRSALWPRLVGAQSVRRELPFLFDLDGFLLSGVLDAFIDSTTIVDYKLGAPTPERMARYQTQLRIYAAAIRAATGRTPADAALYYLDSGDLVAVDVRENVLDETVELAAAVLRGKWSSSAASTG